MAVKKIDAEPDTNVVNGDFVVAAAQQLERAGAGSVVILKRLVAPPVTVLELRLFRRKFSVNSGILHPSCKLAESRRLRQVVVRDSTW